MTDDQVGQHASVILFGGQPHVFYYDADPSTGGLRHAWWDGARWNFETLDGRGSVAGIFSPPGNGRTSTHDVGQYAAAMLYGGLPHIWYYDADPLAGGLRHAWWDGARWNFETLDGDGVSDGRTTDDVGQYSAVVGYAGAPHVWYLDAAGGLRHSWFA